MMLKNSQESLIEYLEKLSSFSNGKAGWTYSSTIDLLLKKGMFFPKIQSVPPSRKMRQKQCFHNCGTIASDSYGADEMIYCEGYAISSKIGIAIPHAWLVKHDGWVFDPTWRDNENDTYFGIPFAGSFVLRNACKIGRYGILNEIGTIRPCEEDPNNIDLLATNQIDESLHKGIVEASYLISDEFPFRAVGEQL